MADQLQSVEPQGVKRNFRSWHFSDINAVSELSPLCAAKQTSANAPEFMGIRLGASLRLGKVIAKALPNLDAPPVSDCEQKSVKLAT
jgi:hypothetical protein